MYYQAGNGKYVLRYLCICITQASPLYQKFLLLHTQLASRLFRTLKTNEGMLLAVVVADEGDVSLLSFHFCLKPPMPTVLSPLFYGPFC